MRSISLFPALALFLVVNACSSSNQPDPSTVPVTAVKVTPLTVQLSAIGETRQLTATIAPLNATDRAITWESSDANVVTVSATGVVTAMAAGSGVLVTAVTHDGHHESSSNISVSP